MQITNSSGGDWMPTTPGASGDWIEIGTSLVSTGLYDGEVGLLKLISWGTTNAAVTAELTVSPTP